LRSLLSWVLFWLPLLAGAAPFEIRVFTDELAPYDDYTLETHANIASRTGVGTGNPATPFQVMPEYSYGMWRNWEISIQLPIAAQSDRLRSNALRAELEYVAPHEDDQGWYRGVNVELAKLAGDEAQRFWTVEIIPIIGLRVDRWHFAANPGISRPLGGSARKIGFDPAAKVAYRVFGNNYFGVEYYLEAGPIQHWLPSNQRSQVIYLVWDGKIGKSDINVGFGRGVTGASDRWVLKTAFEF
jgi:hypothetical protein